MTKEEKRFKLFKETCRHWQEKLGLIEYELNFDHTKLDGNRAEIDINQLGKCVTVTLNNKLQKGDDLDVRHLARHEMFHLLICRLTWLGRSRCIMIEDIIEADETIVKKLDHLFGDDYD